MFLGPSNHVVLADLHSLVQSFNLMWTILHQPVVNVPGFKGQTGLPIGLSIVGPRFHDNELLKVAEAIAPVFAKGGWKSKV